MFIKSVDSDYMTSLYTYLAIFVIYNCAKKIIEMLWKPIQKNENDKIWKSLYNINMLHI